MSKHKALWDFGVAPAESARLERDVQTDVAVVGGGITGVSTALGLLQEGKRVVLLERGRLCDGATGRTSGHLATQLDRRYTKLASTLEREKLQWLALAARRAIDAIQERVHAGRIDCGFERVTGYTFTEKASERGVLEQECALLRELGFDASVLDGAPLPFATSAALAVKGEALFQPRAYVMGMLEEALALGLELYEHSEVSSFEEGEPCQLETSHGPVVRATDVVFAAHAPLTRLALQTKLGHFNSYVLAFEGKGPVTSGLYCDLDDPYHFIRSAEHQGRPCWVVGGEDHRTGLEGDTTKRYEQLFAWAAQRFGVSEREVLFRWSGEVLESVDGLPFVGRIPGTNSLWTATGFGGTGLTWGSLAAEIVRDGILDRANTYGELFSPSRGVAVSAAGAFLADGATVMRCYLGDVFKLAETAGVDSVEKGEGRVVRHDGKLVAAYRDAKGGLKVVAARCPHMGGLVRFNKAETTWDCPCHGSRFRSDGSVLTGPALTGLEPVALDPPASQVPALESDKKPVTA